MIYDPPIKEETIELITRSPEAFPELTLFPEGWDLSDLQLPSKLKKPSNMENSRMPTFPETTDAWI